MQAQNLLTQLAGYSLNPHKRSIENFTTELLAHFFNKAAGRFQRVEVNAFHPCALRERNCQR